MVAYPWTIWILIPGKLFYFDTAPGQTSLALSERQDETAAWEDSDDDRLAVSLAGNSRLRKLRHTEGEDVVNGREYISRLRDQFERLHPVPDWALPARRPSKRRRRSSQSSDSSSSNDMDVDEEDLSALPLGRLLRDVTALDSTRTAAKRMKLRPEVIDIQRDRDIPTVQSGPVTALSFHQEYPILLSSGPSSILYLHHLSSTAHPTPNPLLTSVHLKGASVTNCAFQGPAGEKIFFAGPRRHFHTWDLHSGTIQKVTRIYGQQEKQKNFDRFKLSPCGRYMAVVGTTRKGGGEINILNAGTTQWLATARIEGRHGVADFAWWRSGEGFTVVSKTGEVGEYEISSQSFIARWTDHGSMGATVLALGGSHGPKALGRDRWLAIGSESGVVNIYDRTEFVDGANIRIPRTPKPTKELMQLTTPTSHLEISPDGQCMVMSSQSKKDALRLVHLPSCTVYKNWPTSNTPLGRVTAVAWGKGSDVLAIANDAGKIRLFEVRR